MQQFTIHTVDSAPAGSRAALAALHERVGFVPNLAATMAQSPTLIEGFVQLQGLLAGAELTGVERETVAMTLSHDNTSGYSMAAHSTFAARHGASSEVIAALRAGKDVSDARLAALQGFTRSLLHSRGHLDRDDVDAFLAAGYSRTNVFEVIAQIAYTTIANLSANVCRTPVDTAFEPNTWTG